jgi:hypothetical protein
MADPQTHHLNLNSKEPRKNRLQKASVESMMRSQDSLVVDDDDNGISMEKTPSDCTGRQAGGLDHGSSTYLQLGRSKRVKSMDASPSCDMKISLS